MTEYKRDPRGRLLLLILGVILPAGAGITVAVRSEWRGVLLAAVSVPATFLWLRRFTGSLEFDSDRIRFRRGGLNRWIEIVLSEVRHLRFRPAWIQTSDFLESLELDLDAGRTVRIPTSFQGWHGLCADVRAMLIPLLRERRLREWQESWSLRFHAPGFRWAAHLLVGLTAILGAATGAVLWKFWSGVSMVLGLAATAGIVVLLVLLRRHVVWYGAEVLLNVSGVRILRVDYDREFPWSAMTAAYLGERNRVHLEFGRETIRVPAHIDDRYLLLEFAEMGRRLALPTRRS